MWTSRDGSKDTWIGVDQIAATSAFIQKSEPDVEHQIQALDTLSAQWVSEAKPILREETIQASETQVITHLEKLCGQGFQIVAGLAKPDEVDRVTRLINKQWIESGRFKIVCEPIPKGIIIHNRCGTPPLQWPGVANSKGVVFVSEPDLHPHIRIRLGRKRERKKLEISQVDAMLDFTELADGDPLVHQQHGICIFRGITVLDYASNMESLALEFAGESMLYVPLTETHLLTRYVGLTKRPPKLGKLGSSQWDRDRKAAEKATLDLATQLLALQARRDTIPGFAFPPDDEWMKQFEKAFPYQETPDQQTAIDQSKGDMEKSRPMDRLICGDVGFGKTEVAIRTAFKAVEAGKQVALLVPTTVLCQQHFQTFKERMSPYPVTVDTISGFRTASEQRKSLKLLRQGTTDVIVGTHRLLSKDVGFHDLGLIIVDEEHRFGVKQKEKLKQISAHVDVLTLSATPIPRTLYMALAGARDLSVIETPPRNRKPIETVVRSYSTQIVDSAIRAEVDRGGQVFYLHNRVSTIERVASMINDRNPNLRVAVGHGQMERNDLEKIMARFVAGEYDVMVCTTIIESGLDIPNCNTLIIEGADKFGLAQLYQIRGRVGRFNRQAYAYLLLHDKKPIADIARKRLSAIRQHNELGAGYRIAMRDLELRGAGNILGSAQSGHIAGVGFELYCRLLKQSVSQFKTGKTGPLVRATVNLDFAKMGEPTTLGGTERKDIKSNYEILKDSEDETTWVEPTYAFIPASYIHETKLRIEFYRKLATAAELDEVKTIRAGMKDRFGKIPEPTEALIRISAIRCLAELKKFASVESDKGRLKLRIAHPTELKYYKQGTQFPRLTKKSPLLLLNDCLSFLSKL